MIACFRLKVFFFSFPIYRFQSALKNFPNHLFFEKKEMMN